jgi:hypothetical protein
MRQAGFRVVYHLGALSMVTVALASGCGSSGTSNANGSGGTAGGAGVTSGGASSLSGGSAIGGSTNGAAGSATISGGTSAGGTSSEAGAAGAADTSGGAPTSGGSGGGSAGAGACSPDCKGVCSFAHCVTAAATSLQGASGLTVDANYIYYGSRLSGDIYRAPLAGGSGVPLISKGIATQTEDLVLAGSTLFWTTNSSQSVLQAAIAGDTATAVSTTEKIPYGIATNGTDVFWANHYQAANSIGHALVAGGGKNPIISGAPQVVYPTYVAADASYVYWGNAGQSGTDGSVYRAKLDGTMPVALATGQGPVYGIAIDATNVYFTTTSGTVSSVPKTSDGSVTPVPLDASGGYLLGIVADATDIYWIDEGNERIRHRAKSANAADTFASLQLQSIDPYLGEVTYLALDAQHVYWSDNGTQSGHGAVLIANR